MKKNPGRKHRRSLQFTKQDKISIAYQIIGLKKVALKSKNNETIALAKSINIDMNKMDGYTRDSICQIRAQFKKVLETK